MNVRTDKLFRRDAQLAGLLAYIRDTQAARLHGYHGSDVDLILRLLRQPLPLFTAPYNGSSPDRTSETAAVAGSWTASTAPHHADHPDEHDTMHEIAHGLHFASIAMLGFLVVEVRVVLSYKPN